MAFPYVPLDEYAYGETIQEDPSVYIVTQDQYYAGYQYGPFSMEGRAFMAERCAKTWDDACKVYAANVDPSIPDENEGLDNPFHPRPEGQKHIRRTAEKKFCTLGGDNCYKSSQPVNWDAPNSPYFDTYIGNCLKTCDKFTQEDLYTDPVLKECAKTPGLCQGTLLGMLATAKSKGMKTKNSLLVKGLDPSMTMIEGPQEEKTTFYGTPVESEAKADGISKEAKISSLAFGVILLIIVIVLCCSGRNRSYLVEE